MEVENLNYLPPEVTLLHASPMWVAEVAARTAYDSFANSEWPAIQEYPATGWAAGSYDIPSSAILTQLAWVYHHHSVIELINLSFSIKGTSRGVLQEHARHRIQSLTVRSTRYTMSGVLNAFVASSIAYRDISVPTARGMFNRLITELDILVIDDLEYMRLETDSMYNKLCMQTGTDYTSMLSKEGQEIVTDHPGGRDDTLFYKLQKAKKKRNVGDAYKHLVTDNWKVDMVISFNLRSLKNYLGLRNSGAAYFQMKMLAEAIQAEIPEKYRDLIVKKAKT